MFLQIPWEVSQSAVCLHSLHHYLYLCFTISDALKATRAPLIFSHSSARSVANVTRNVPDDVLEKVVSIILFFTNLWKNVMISLKDCILIPWHLLLMPTFIFILNLVCDILYVRNSPVAISNKYGSSVWIEKKNHTSFFMPAFRI